MSTEAGFSDQLEQDALSTDFEEGDSWLDLSEGEEESALTNEFDDSWVENVDGTDEEDGDSLDPSNPLDDSDFLDGGLDDFQDGMDSFPPEDNI